jgi:tetratricopeptide (TPR) repeat protein
MHFMLGWKSCRRLLPALILLTVAACRPTPDVGIDPVPPLPSTMLVIGPFAQQGMGFLVDRDERLVIVSAHTVGKDAKDADVIFPVIEDGKAKTRRDFYLKQPHVTAQVLHMDVNHDLAVIQVRSLPEGFAQLKLAAALPEANAAVQTVVDPGTRSTVWAPKTATVVGSSVEIFSELGQRVEARVVEVTLDSKFAKGSAGAPIINEAGELVAVITPCSASKSRVMGIEAKEARSALCGAYRTLRAAAFKEKDYTKSLAYCDKVLALEPDDALIHNERGAALSYLNRLDEAIKEYTEAIKLNPKLAIAYRNRGSAYLEMGNAQADGTALWRKAVDDCSQALKIDDKYISAYRKRHDAYLKLNQSDLARKDKEIIDELVKRNWWSSSDH